MRSNRQHRYDDYTPDESSVCCDKVRITNIHSIYGIRKIGYISRYNTKQFRFIGVEFCNELCHKSDSYASEVLNYKDWKIEYIK